MFLHICSSLEVKSVLMGVLLIYGSCGGIYGQCMGGKQYFSCVILTNCVSFLLLGEKSFFSCFFP